MRATIRVTIVAFGVVTTFVGAACDDPLLSLLGALQVAVGLVVMERRDGD